MLLSGYYSCIGFSGTVCHWLTSCRPESLCNETESTLERTLIISGTEFPARLKLEYLLVQVFRATLFTLLSTFATLKVVLTVK